MSLTRTNPQLDALDSLPVPQSKVIVEYVWIGGGGIDDFRSKSRTVDVPEGAFCAPSEPNVPTLQPADVPCWTFDGSSTGQASGHDSEVALRCVATFVDPWRRAPHVLALCDLWRPGRGGRPLDGNTRVDAAAIFEQVAEHETWFGIEQEYVLFDSETSWPLGWPKHGFPAPQGEYYCGTGADRVYGRRISDAHYKACLYAGINISGTNVEVMPGQHEYQVGPCVGIDAADQVTMSRFILQRVCELAGVRASFHPKPIAGDWNGSGAHVNFSTKHMRDPTNRTGYEAIIASIEKLKELHSQHVVTFGDPEQNRLRLTGKHETCSMDKFSWGVADRGASVRVGRETEESGHGYLEDRRPASNMDCYVVTSTLAKATLL